MNRRFHVAVGVAAVGVTAMIIVVTGGALVPKQPEAASPGSSRSSVAMQSDSGSPLDEQIVALQQQLRGDPSNAIAWGTLGLDYVQQAKNTVNPDYYPKADGAIAKSLSLGGPANYVGMAGQAALHAARHDFAGALTWAKRGIAANPYNPTLYGTLADAQTQLGQYANAAASVQKMVDLQPGVASFTRAEYVFELRGDLPAARSAMQRALDDASSAADRGFAYYYLGELAFNSGDAAGALEQVNRGLVVDPGDATLLEGKARAEAALGKTQDALRDYATVVGKVPQPQYVIEYGELLQSVGRAREAQQQYQLFESENELFTSNGVQLDTDPTLFYADHGQPAKALQFGAAGIKTRPFVEMQDAYAWALHRNGRDDEALSIERSVATVGTRNALFSYHRGMIERSLGQTAAARVSLSQALGLNPHFNPLQAPIARQMLTQLDGATP